MVFNGNVVTYSKAVVCPLDAEDVSKYVCPLFVATLSLILTVQSIVLYCVKHSLSPSVKAGGYGTAGWAIGGDIIVDVSKLVEVDIEIPTPEGSFTSLRDVAPANSKGKKALEPSAAPSRRSRREEDVNLRDYDAASEAVASFLRGPPFTMPPSNLGPSNSGLPLSAADSPLPLTFPPPTFVTESNVTPSAFGYLEVPTVQLPTSSPTSDLSSGNGYSSSPISASDSTRFTTPSLSPLVEAPMPLGLRVFEVADESNSSNPPSNASPFSYLDGQSNFPPAPVPTTLLPHYPQSFTSSGPWFTPGSAFGQTSAAIPVQAEPIYSHVYVTFGAGMRQKEIDAFTANHKIEARYLSGSGDGIPYHVPL